MRPLAWTIDRRDFLKVSAGALAGLATAGVRLDAQTPVRFGLVTDSHYADADQLGNHDMDNISKPQMLAGITNTGIARDRSYYVFSHRGLRFIVLDACYLENGQPYDHGNFDYRDTWVPEAELEWLDRELTASREPVIVLAHQRLDGEGSLHVKNSATVRALLERSKKVLAVFMGHDHPGAYNQVNGLHYYTQKAVVEGSGGTHNAYTIVTVDAAMNITVTGYRTAVSKDLPRGLGS